ncbi:hypothetical protein DU508_14675 [Pedobacter chinensis]|uniref:Uncharacterized protein n=1 Tax=Pedobacter chinensis TaxID=2282421 RepID=A0A369PZN1_9SPHI|nr:hypothetical protein DU508_14675 [Pedobacter chinensis]
MKHFNKIPWISCFRGKKILAADYGPRKHRIHGKIKFTICGVNELRCILTKIIPWISCLRGKKILAADYGPRKHRIQGKINLPHE